MQMDNQEINSVRVNCKANFDEVNTGFLFLIIRDTHPALG